MQTLKVRGCLPSGRGVNRASMHYDNMVALHSGNRDGVVSMIRHSQERGFSQRNHHIERRRRIQGV